MSVSARGDAIAIWCNADVMTVFVSEQDARGRLLTRRAAPSGHLNRRYWGFHQSPPAPTILLLHQHLLARQDGSNRRCGGKQCRRTPPPTFVPSSTWLAASSDRFGAVSRRDLHPHGGITRSERACTTTNNTNMATNDEGGVGGGWWEVRWHQRPASRGRPGWVFQFVE